MAETNSSEWTVGRYLATRLEQLGIRHLFGVPGNHLGPFLEILHKHTSVEWVGTPTEIGAGFAADAYARTRRVDGTHPRIAAAATTYSVGSFSLLNPIGGAYVEYIPIIAINASPTYEQWLNYQAIGLLTSHMSQRRESNLEVYRQVTVDAQVISNPGLAPMQIDGAIVACLSERRPVYLEVMEDVWTAPCEAPHGTLTARRRPVTEANRKMLGKAVAAAVDLIEDFGTPILWAGEEIDRFDLAGEFADLVADTGIPFCTTIGGKAVLSEDNPDFVGVYNGKASLPKVREIFKNVAGCRIGMGSWSTSKNLGGEQSVGSDWIVAAKEGVSVGASYFPDVQLGEFIKALRQRLVERFGTRSFEADYFSIGNATGLDVPGSVAAYRSETFAAPQGNELTYDSLFCRVNRLLRDSPGRYTVVSDAAFALLGSMNLHMAEPDTYLAQNSWLSIGYSVGATSGAAMARGDRRPLVFVGDGSFQETCQELSTHVRHGLRPVVFVLDNEGFYGIEQMLVQSCYYTKPPAADADFYNILHRWNYQALAEVFTTDETKMTAFDVRDLDQVERAFGRIDNPADEINKGPILVRVRLRRDDYPAAVQYKVDECAITVPTQAESVESVRPVGATTTSAT
ncbi:alpha-keto acid decarboxylase family protein [Actinokineospora iranica]|uniref:Alpha-keto-acid decarboxylase n=1 Tax=Actinokineospora iranica TaxID=1271860 RepID=A0A1G6XNJ0_9PSEU|nr:thiamine pyrophosphate-binding protein [Actinokineospora iranica]SDD78846.1 indolepyruvate decarboxylase [Actinokineospora iranica]